jgi:hypothetical protein
MDAKFVFGEGMTVVVMPVFPVGTLELTDDRCSSSPEEDWTHVVADGSGLRRWWSLRS